MPVPTSDAAGKTPDIVPIANVDDTTRINLALAYDMLDEATRPLIDGLRLITYNPFKAQARRPCMREPRSPPTRSAAK